MCVMISVVFTSIPSLQFCEVGRWKIVGFCLLVVFELWALYVVIVFEALWVSLLPAFFPA